MAKPKRWDEWRLETLRRMLKEGYSQKEIGQVIGMAHPTVARKCSELGLKRVGLLSGWIKRLWAGTCGC